MTLVKDFVLVLFLIILSHSVLAMDDSKQALMSQLDTLKSFSAKFEQNVVDANGVIVNQASGTIALAQPNKLRWHTEMPDEILLIADGDALYQVDYFVEQVSIVNQASAIENNPMILLTSKDPSDWDKFDVTLSDSGYLIQAKQQGAIRSLSLVFADGILTQITSVDSQEQESRLIFTEQNQNTPLPLETFVPNVPSGFIVDDQRT